MYSLQNKTLQRFKKMNVYIIEVSGIVCNWKVKLLLYALQRFKKM